MARNRIIKTSFVTDKDLNRLSLEANLFYTLMWLFCDDYGAIVNSDRSLLGKIFPHRNEVIESDVAMWKDELIGIGALIECEYDGVPLLVVRQWESHQRVPNPSKKRLIPGCFHKKVIELYEDNIDKDKDYIESNEGLIRVYIMNKNKNKKENRDRVYRKIIVKNSKVNTTGSKSREGY